jgi:predicted KAP-like P-loop ATPase
MKLYIPEPVIAHDEGFSEKADIFQRKPFGERLANLVRSCKDGIVIALDAQWGEGKSTFIKMWRGHIGQDAENPIKSLYFDAFANDYQKDPFLALAGELYELVTDEKEEKKKEFKDKAKGVAKSLARGAVKIAVRTISGGIVDGSMIDSAEKDVSELFADQVDSIIADKLENAKKDKLAIENFRGYLEKFAHDHGNGSPIVFIIDELDRCRPDFALDLLEQIKHLFSVKGIVFLLVLNRSALEEIISV